MASPGRGCSDFPVAVLRQGSRSQLGGPCHTQDPDTTVTEPERVWARGQNGGSSGLPARAGGTGRGRGSYGVRTPVEPFRTARLPHARLCAKQSTRPAAFPLGYPQAASSPRCKSSLSHQLVPRCKTQLRHPHPGLLFLVPVPSLAPSLHQMAPVKVPSDCHTAELNAQSSFYLTSRQDWTQLISPSSLKQFLGLASRMPHKPDLPPSSQAALCRPASCLPIFLT